MHGKMLFRPDGGSQPGSPPEGGKPGDPPPKKEGEAPPGDPPPKKEGEAPPPKKEGDGEQPPRKTLLEGGDGAPPPKKEESKAPEKYELKLPKDSKLDPTITDRISAQARELNLSNEAAQKLLDSYDKEYSTGLEAVLGAQQRGGAEWVKRVDGYEDAFLNDKEIGGDNSKQSIAMSQRVMKTFFSPDVEKFLGDSGMGSHPEIIRALVKIGKAMGEDKLITVGTGGAGDGEAPEDTGDKLYPTTKKVKQGA